MALCKKICAFTLIELLVVISVIALLIAILLPALGHAHSAARTQKCSINQRSIAQAFQLYSADNKERFPHWSQWHTYRGDGTGDDTPGPGWAEQVEQYVDTFDVFQCPARKRDELPVAFFIQARFTASRTQAQFYQSLYAPDVKLTSQFVVLGDGTNPNLFSAPYGNSPKKPNVDPDDARWQAVFYRGETRPHPGKGGDGGEGSANLAFFDGHVKDFHQYEADTMTWHGNQMLPWTQVH
jgi:prepilin-type N-terminal cleavage/methylation domain-containing protein/prepilin-type processing-associated H-X9-DG protein